MVGGRPFHVKRGNRQRRAPQRGPAESFHVKRLRFRIQDLRALAEERGGDYGEAFGKPSSVPQYGQAPVVERSVSYLKLSVEWLSS